MYLVLLLYCVLQFFIVFYTLCFYSQVIKDLIGRHSKTPEATDLDNLIITQLKKSLQTSIEKHNDTFTQTILHTVGEMAQYVILVLSYMYFSHTLALEFTKPVFYGFFFYLSQLTF